MEASNSDHINVYVEPGMLQDSDQVIIDSFYQQIKNEVKDFSFLECKFSPELQRSPDHLEDAFTWNVAWTCNFQTSTEQILKDRLPENVYKLIDDFCKNFWNACAGLIRSKNHQGSAPWNGLAYHFTLYDGHETWKSDEKSSPTFHYYNSLKQNVKHRKIVSVIQVKDSDIFIGQVIDRALIISDEILIIHNESEDSTREIIKSKMSQHKNIQLREVISVSSGSRYLHNLCGTNSIVLRLDSDEIWDKLFLKHLRDYLLREDLNKFHGIIVKETELFVLNFDLPDLKHCQGKIRDTEFIFNFANIVRWPQVPERLHGSEKIVKENTSKLKLSMNQIQPKRSVPAVLHFSLLSLCSKGHETTVPGWMKNKMSVLARDYKEIKLNLKDFDIHKELVNSLYASGHTNKKE